MINVKYLSTYEIWADLGIRGQSMLYNHNLFNRNHLMDKWGTLYPIRSLGNIVNKEKDYQNNISAYIIKYHLVTHNIESYGIETYVTFYANMKLLPKQIPPIFPFIVPLPLTPTLNNTWNPQAAISATCSE